MLQSHQLYSSILTSLAEKEFLHFLSTIYILALSSPLGISPDMLKIAQKLQMAALQ